MGITTKRKKALSSSILLDVAKRRTPGRIRRRGCGLGRPGAIGILLCGFPQHFDSP